MNGFSLWETLAIGALALLAVFWFAPGLRGATLRARRAEADWGAALVPLGLVAAFVIFLILVS
jgi:hypothetical protein